MDSNNGVLLNLNRMRNFNMQRKKSNSIHKIASQNDVQGEFMNAFSDSILNKREMEGSKRQRRETCKKMVKQAIYQMDSQDDIQRVRASSNNKRTHRNTSSWLQKNNGAQDLQVKKILSERESGKRQANYSMAATGEDNENDEIFCYDINAVGKNMDSINMDDQDNIKESLLQRQSDRNVQSINFDLKGSMAIQDGFQEATRNRSESMTGGLYDDVNYGLTSEQRSRQIKKHFVFGFFELTLVCISILLIINFAPNDIRIIDKKDFTEQFQLQVLAWISVYGALYTILFFRRVVFILEWIYMTDPRYAQTNCNCFTFVFLNSFEFIWFIYGNTFFYNSGGISSEDQNLWLVMLCILIYGYINMFIYSLACCGIFTVVATFYARGFLTKKEMVNYDSQLDQRKQKLALINQNDNDKSMTIKISQYIEETTSHKLAAQFAQQRSFTDNSQSMSQQQTYKLGLRDSNKQIPKSPSNANSLARSNTSLQDNKKRQQDNSIKQSTQLFECNNSISYNRAFDEEMGSRSHQSKSPLDDQSNIQATSEHQENHSQNISHQQLQINGLMQLAGRYGFKQGIDQLELSIKNGNLFLGVNQENESVKFKKNYKASGNNTNRSQNGIDVSVISDEMEEIQTDVRIYEPIEGLDRKRVIQAKEECSVCLMKFKSSSDNQQNIAIVKSRIDHYLKVSKDDADINTSQTNSHKNQQKPMSKMLGGFDDDDIIQSYDEEQQDLTNSISSDSSTETQLIEISRRKDKYYHLICFQTFYNQVDIIQSLDASEQLKD